MNYAVVFIFLLPFLFFFVLDYSYPSFSLSSLLLSPLLSYIPLMSSLFSPLLSSSILSSPFTLLSSLIFSLHSPLLSSLLSSTTPPILVAIGQLRRTYRLETKRGMRLVEHSLT
jgi:hypothetical protein